MIYKSIDYKWIFSTRTINRRGNRFWEHQIIVEAENYEKALLEMKYLAEKKRWLVLGINEVSATPISADGHDGQRVYGAKIENPPPADIPAVLHMNYEIRDAKREVHIIADTEFDTVIEDADKKRKMSWPELQKDAWYRVNRMNPDYWEDKYKKLVKLKALIDFRPEKKTRKKKQ